jgi:TonB family protein
MQLCSESNAYRIRIPRNCDAGLRHSGCAGKQGPAPLETTVELLEEIRLLGNYESASEKFLQILLLGQPELDDLLNRRDLRQLKQRIALRLHIDPLPPSEVQQYIRVRWASAGAQEAPPFSPDALARIAQWSQGIPRLINSLCDSALLMAYSDESPVVGSNYVRDAASNLRLIDSPPQPPDASSPNLSDFSASVSPIEKLQAFPKLPSVELPDPPLEALPVEPVPTGPRDAVEADKRHRSEARAAAEEAEFHKRGVDKALKLIQEREFNQAADTLRNLLSLFPGDPILERHLASAQRMGEQHRAIEEPAPSPAAETMAKLEEPAGPREAGPAAAAATPNPSNRSRRFRWGVPAVCGVLLLLTIGVIWDRTTGRNQSNAPPPAQVTRKDLSAQAQVEPAATPAVPGSAAPAAGPASAPEKQQPIQPRGTLSPKALRIFNASNALALGSQAQPGPQSTLLPVPPTGLAGGSGPEPAISIPDLSRPRRPVPPPTPPSQPQPSTPASTLQPNLASGNFSPATAISHSAPEMPMLARQAGIHGAVDLVTAIDKQGIVRDVRVVDGNPVLAAAAKQAVLKWRYQPATRNGQPVESELAVRVLFAARK